MGDEILVDERNIVVRGRGSGGGFLRGLCVDLSFCFKSSSYSDLVGSCRR